jgi:aspartyl-tRNA(Asn)/glutamyl-tRNA(Gln) amidotransferase subunit C
MILYNRGVFKGLEVEKMGLNIAEIRRIGRLARIALEEGEVVAMQRQLAEIFKLIEELQAADTSNVESMAHAQEVSLRLREDRVTECDQRELFQSLAPQSEAHLYLVPKVIE